MKIIGMYANENGLEIQLEKVEDIAEIMSFGAISTLGVVIDNKVVHACDVPNQKSIRSWLSGNETTETENSGCCDVGKCCQEQKVYE